MNTIRKTFLLRTSVLAIAAAVSMGNVFAKDEGKAAGAVATVNGKPIAKAQIEMLVAGQMQQGQADTPELRAAIRERLVNDEILFQEAQKKGFDKKSDVQLQIDVARSRIVSGAYLQDYVQKNPISDNVIKAEYDTIKAKMGDKEYHARHILVGSEAEATGIIEKLNKGAKFEELAGVSMDPGSKERGGDLGWSTPVSYVKPFSDAMVQLTRGSYTKTPVKSDFGYHVIMLEDTRELKFPAFEEAKPQISQRMMQQMVEKHMQELRGKAKVQ